MYNKLIVLTCFKENTNIDEISTLHHKIFDNSENTSKTRIKTF